MNPTMIAAFLLAASFLSLVPGPDMLFIVANAAVGGRRAGVVSAVGMSTGLALHTFAAALGLGALIQAAPEALGVVRLIGALLLLYFAVSAWRTSRSRPRDIAADTSMPRRSLRRTYVMATLTNLANPKVILFYLAFLPQFLTTGSTAWPPWLQLVVLGALFIGVGLPVDATVGLAAGRMAEKILDRPSVRRRLQRASAVIFGGLAVRLLLEAH